MSFCIDMSIKPKVPSDLNVMNISKLSNRLFDITFALSIY